MLSKNLKKIRSFNGQLLRYLSASSAQSKTSQSSQIQVSTLPSGVLLASLDSESPLARFAVIVRAGSRYEPQNKLGISHVVRSAAGLATEKYTSFGITRNIEYHGGRLTVAGTRDSIAYLLEVHNEDEIAPEHFSMVADTVANPAFKHWELADNVERLNADRSMMEDNPLVQLTEMIHQVAFKGGLRNSLYVPKNMVGKHSTEDLKKYHQQTFVGSNTVVVGIGVDHQYLREIVGQTMVLPASARPQEKSIFIGGQTHLGTSSPLTYIALACEGASLNKNPKDYIAAQIMQKIMGSGSQIKSLFGLNRSQRLARAVGLQLSGQRPSEDFSIAAFNYNYENSGIFGWYLVAPNNYDIPALTKAVVKEFRASCNSITDAELNDAKNNLKASTLIAMDDEGTLAYEIGNHLLMSGEKFSLDDFIKQIDEITVADVKSLGSRMLKSKVAMASIGANAPYLEDIVE